MTVSSSVASGACGGHRRSSGDRAERSAYGRATRLPSTPWRTSRPSAIPSRSRPASSRSSRRACSRWCPATSRSSPACPSTSSARARKDVLAPTFAFVLGFSLMFTAYGASAGLIGYSFTQDQDSSTWSRGSPDRHGRRDGGPAPMASCRRPAAARPPADHPGGRRPGGRGLRGGLDAVHRPDPRQHPHLRRAHGLPRDRRDAAVHLLAGARDPVPARGAVRDPHHGRVPLAARPLDRRQRGAPRVFVAIGVLVATGRFEVITQRLSGVGFSGI